MKKSNLSISLFFLFGLLALSATLYATFVWLDHNGNARHTQFQTQPHQVKEYLASGQYQQKKAPKVDLYVTSWCPYCHKAQAFFQARNIAVTIYDIEKDNKAAAQKRKLDPQPGVPFVVVNGQGIHGYAPGQYLQALQGKGEGR